MAKPLSGAILLTGLLAMASPADAQYDRRSRAERVADEIAREIEATAGAIGAVTDSVSRSVDSLRWRGGERFAADRCAARAERYGRVRIDRVDRYGRRSWRVYGSVEGGGYFRAWRGGPALRTFACTVRDDGRVKLKTHRLRRY
ncbi:MAG TPA: hypothetical protein VF605_02280 [Allosphingosinicella sp.]|jgi:hypothetical protein